MKRFIDLHRHTFGVEPICRVLQIAPSCYWRHAARRRNSDLRSTRAQRDDWLANDVQRVRHANWQAYGADKVWLQMNREGIRVAGCTVERLMRRLGLEGARRGRKVRTTIPDALAPCPLDRVNRVFQARRPNELWVSDLTGVSTWQGWLYVAFVVDVFARGIVGWRVSRTMHPDFVFDALEQALYERQPNALAKTINGLYKTELIHRRAPWKIRESVELASLQWVHWLNHIRLLEPIEYVPPAEAEANSSGNSQRRPKQQS